MSLPGLSPLCSESLILLGLNDRNGPGQSLSLDNASPPCPWRRSRSRSGSRGSSAPRRALHQTPEPGRRADAGVGLKPRQCEASTRVATFGSTGCRRCRDQPITVAELADLLPLRVIPQHPDSTGPEEVLVPAPVVTGPIGPRLAVFDYNRDYDVVFRAATTRKDGTFPDYEVDDLRFHQLNAYGIAARAISMVEDELGRTLSWGFQASRLNVLPHAGLMRNAFYSEATKSIQLFSFHREDGKPYHTALAHDVVAHETGHALLDAIRDRYTEITDPETAALHEAIGDLTAVMAALSFDSVQEAISDDDGHILENNVVADVADAFTGDAADATAPLRNLAQLKDPAEFQDETNPHILSLKLSQAAYLAYRQFVEIRLAAGDDRYRALNKAHQALQRMLVRGLDFLPPAGGRFADYAHAVLAADAIAHPEDELGFRAAFRGILEARRVIEAEADGARVRTQRWTPIDRWPVVSREAAYLFLSRHRRRLALGSHGTIRDFIVASHHVTLPKRGPQRTETPEASQVIIVYEYPVDIAIDMGVVGSRYMTVWGGGTLVFDGDCRLRYHAERPVTRQRVSQAKRFVGSNLSYHTSLSGVEYEPLESYRIGRSFTASVGERELTMRSNLAAGCTELISQEGSV